MKKIGNTGIATVLVSMSASFDEQAAALRVCKEDGKISVLEYAIALAELRRIQAAAHALQEEARSAAVGQQSQRPH